MTATRRVTAAALLAAVALPSPVSAQSVGVKAGANAATLTNASEHFPEPSHRLGAAAGLFVTVPAGERFSFQIEGLYSEKGITMDGEVLGLIVDGDLRIRYLEVPVLARADFGTPGAAARLYAVAGAAPAYKLDSRIALERVDDSHDDTIDRLIDDLDVGLVAGVGVSFGRASLEARYTHGLRAIQKDLEGEDDHEIMRNRVVSVTAGFRFR